MKKSVHSEKDISPDLAQEVICKLIAEQRKGTSLEHLLSILSNVEFHAASHFVRARATEREIPRLAIQLWATFKTSPYEEA